MPSFCSGATCSPLPKIQQRLLREQSARERDLQKVRSAETHFRIILEASDTPIVLLDPDAGRITEINTAAADLLGSTTDLLYSSAFAQAFEGRRQSEFMDAISAAASADERKTIEVVSRRNGRIVKLCPEFFRASGDLVLLCRMQHMDDKDAAGPEFTQTLASLYWRQHGRHPADRFQGQHPRGERGVSRDDRHGPASRREGSVACGFSCARRGGSQAHA